MMQYSNHEELFTPPPNAVPEFPSFPDESELDEFTAATTTENEPGDIIEDEIERWNYNEVWDSFKTLLLDDKMPSLIWHCVKRMAHCSIGLTSIQTE